MKEKKMKEFSVILSEKEMKNVVGGNEVSLCDSGNKKVCQSHSECPGTQKCISSYGKRCCF